MARVLDDLVFVVTGASSGIGRATALEAAKAGMNVVVTARRADRLTEVVAAIEGCGRRAHAVVGDVADAGFSKRLLDETDRALGRADAVFANAGFGAERRVLDFGDEEIRRLFEVNLFAATDLLREAARRMIERRRGGHLLMCSSCVARFTLPGYGPYAATKAAQLMIARSMRYELREHGIEVSTVHPVATRTEFFEVAASGTTNVDAARGAGAVSNHAPSLFVQPPERVARAVIACLRRPRPEVWTSFGARVGAGLFTVFPTIGDWFLQPHIKHLPPSVRD
ncbi:MAG: SDR family oxidoreductase [Phycisphaerales bacterium]